MNKRRTKSTQDGANLDLWCRFREVDVCLFMGPTEGDTQPADAKDSAVSTKNTAELERGALVTAWAAMDDVSDGRWDRLFRAGRDDDADVQRKPARVKGPVPWVNLSAKNPSLAPNGFIHWRYMVGTFSDSTRAP